MKSASSPLSLKKNFGWTFLGNMVFALSQWGMLIVIAKSSSPNMVGQFALGLAIVNPIMMFSNLQIRQVQATDARHLYRFSDYFYLRGVTLCCAALTLVLIIKYKGYPPVLACLILSVGAAKIADSLSDVFYGLFQQRERMDKIAISMIGRGALSLVTLAVVVRVSGSVVWGAAGWAIVWFIVFFAYDFVNGLRLLVHEGKVVHSASNPKTILSIIGLAAPLGIVMGFISLNNSVPRYFIVWCLGERSLGIFAAMAYSIVAGNTIISALGQSAVPRLAKYFAERDISRARALLYKLTGIAATIGLLGVLISVVAGRQLLTIFYKPEYAENINVLILLMIAALITYVGSLLGCAVSASRRFVIQVPISVGAVLVTAFFCYILIPNYGLEGAALSFIASAIFQSVANGIVVHNALKVRI